MPGGDASSQVMEIKALDFFIGLIIGGGLGVGVLLAVNRIRGWLGHSELSQLKVENRQLKRRLADKDRHIGRMLEETERLAERLGEIKVLEDVEKQELG
jgi:hypothetical protein